MTKHEFKYPICKKCGMYMNYVGKDINKYCSTVYKYHCANGHNNQYCYKKGHPPGLFYIDREAFYNVEDTLIYVQLLQRHDCKFRIRYPKEKRYISMKTLRDMVEKKYK